MATNKPKNLKQTMARRFCADKLKLTNVRSWSIDMYFLVTGEPMQTELAIIVCSVNI